jgi:hypothetical protein
VRKISVRFLFAGFARQAYRLATKEDAMVPFHQVEFRFGTVGFSAFSQFTPGTFAPDVPVTFASPFPSSVNPASIRVFVTPNSAGLEDDRFMHHAGVVGAVAKVTLAGFTLVSFSPDCAPGFAGFNYVALAETPSPLKISPEIRFAVLQPLTQHPDFPLFSSNCVPGDTRFWSVAFNRPFGSTTGPPPVVALSLTNLNVHPFDLDQAGLQPECVPATGMVENPSAAGFAVRARNFDSIGGLATYFYVAIAAPAGFGAGSSMMMVDSGQTAELHFNPGGQHGDWQEITVNFAQPFIAAPVVLVTALNVPKSILPRPVLPQARHVTPFGFTLTGRNALGDPISGVGGTSFAWAAFGCGPGCGG